MALAVPSSPGDGSVTNELAARWGTRDGHRLTEEIFGRLLAGRSLSDLRLGEHEGRIDLRGISTPPPSRLEAFERKGWRVRELGGLLKFDGVCLTDLDFRGGHLESLRFFKATLNNCRFDDARCQDWRLWAVDVIKSSFTGSDLRKSVLGAWYQGRGNVFRDVQFSNANLRAIVCPAATFVDCDFGNAQLVKIDFQSSSFIRCRFAGLLREVAFYDHGFKTGKPDPNPMEDVDFSAAELRMVEFRRLDLERVKFPADADHLVVREYKCVLERALQELNENKRWSGLRAVLELRLKWSGPNQRVGVFNLKDFAEAGDEAEMEYASELLRRLDQVCSAP